MSSSPPETATELFTGSIATEKIEADEEKVNLSLYWSRLAHPAGFYPSFLNINKRPGVSLLPFGWDASSSQGICKNQFKTLLVKKTTTIKATFGDVKT